MITASSKNTGVARIAAVAAMALIGLGFSSTVKGVIINPGNSGVVPLGAGAFGGTVVYPTTITPFTGTSVLGVSFTGELAATVYSDPNNLFGAGDYDFVYQFSNDNNPSNTSIENFSVNDFTGFSTSADYVTGTNVAPTTMSRLPAGTGDVINFVYGPTTSVAFGQSSDVMVVQTNATAYQLGTASLQDGGNARIAAPVPAVVPEPATAAIAGFALVALGMRRRNGAKA